jgi:hypothetical protein|tara:strand:- start:972 stop:1085 length:114 start_codon:yes stop_codon:yes gene_type:complete
MKRKANVSGSAVGGFDSMKVDLNFGWEKIETSSKQPR